MARSRVTIRDVAAQAGVSHQTVSRVINGSDNVRAHTRLKVQEAIEALGYRPNAVARSMAKGRTALMACFAPNLTDYTFATIIEGAQRETRQHGYFLLATSADDEQTFHDLIGELVQSGRVEGLIVIDPYAAELARSVPNSIPTVYAGGGAHAEDPHADSVVLDDEAAAYQATHHLLQIGHRDIAMITGPMNEICTQRRIAGYTRALAGEGEQPKPNLVIEGDWSAVSGYEALQQLGHAGDLPSAVFAQNDQMAVGVLRAGRDMGFDLPKELSVIGVDDIPLAAYFAPPLTTMRQDFEAIGREAAKLLVRAIENPTAERKHIKLPATFIKRRSTTSVVN